MNGMRVWNRELQAASMFFYKKEKRLLLQGMIHWGMEEFFRHIQDEIDACKGIIIKEDNGYLDPPGLLSLDDADFDFYCRTLNRGQDKIREVMNVLLGLTYQWDVLKYSGPPQTLCADVSWREEVAFDNYMHVSSSAGQECSHEHDHESAWNMLLFSKAAARVLLNELIYQCFRLLDHKTGTKPKEKMFDLFSQWSESYRFSNPRKAAGLFYHIVYHFGGDSDESEPEQKAFIFDKREGRVLQLVGKIEQLDYISDISVMYGAGHFDALCHGLKDLGWCHRGPITWTTAWKFFPSTKKAMLQALDRVTSV